MRNGRVETAKRGKYFHLTEIPGIRSKSFSPSFPSLECMQVPYQCTIWGITFNVIFWAIEL